MRHRSHPDGHVTKERSLVLVIVIGFFVSVSRGPMAVYLCWLLQCILFYFQLDYGTEYVFSLFATLNTQ